MSASIKDFTGAINRIQKIRTENLRRSREVVDLWNKFICNSYHALGNDKWLTLEQVFIASLDVGDNGVSNETFGVLCKQFDGSQRLQRLEAMYFESKEQFDDAECIYEGILNEDPVDSTTLKRKVALFKSQGKVSEAVQSLNKYLEINSMDFEGWLELSELYLSQCEYEKAGFCLEELILINPHNHLFHQRYAEIKYSQGEFEVARVYFSQAYRLSDSNVRALYGSILCSQKLAAGKSKAKSESLSIANKAVEELEKKFKAADAPTMSLNRKAISTIMDYIV